MTIYIEQYSGTIKIHDTLNSYETLIDINDIDLYVDMLEHFKRGNRFGMDGDRGQINTSRACEYFNFNRDMYRGNCILVRSIDNIIKKLDNEGFILPFNGIKNIKEFLKKLCRTKKFYKDKAKVKLNSLSLTSLLRIVEYSRNKKGR